MALDPTEDDDVLETYRQMPFGDAVREGDLVMQVLLLNDDGAALYRAGDHEKTMIGLDGWNDVKAVLDTDQPEGEIELSRTRHVEVVRTEDGVRFDPRHEGTLVLSEEEMDALSERIDELRPERYA